MGTLITYKDVFENLIELNQNNYSIISSGLTTSATANKLIDNTATFITNLSNKNMVVENVTDGTYAVIMTVDSETQITIDEDIFALGEEYRIYSMIELSLHKINRAIDFVEAYVFNKLRTVYDEPETDLIGNKTIQDCAIKLVVCRIFKIVYKMNLETLPEIIREICAEGQQIIEDIIEGTIELNITDETKEQTKIYSISDTCIFKKNDYNEVYETNEYWKPNVEVNRIR
jgi:hypothetical protein